MSAAVLEERKTCANCNRLPDFLGGRPFRINAISGCGHKFCSSCIDQGFRGNDSFKCQRCQNLVRRDQLGNKEIEEVEYERDRERRLEFKKIFNKTEADFNTLEEFQDYEEMVEDIIQALVRRESSEKVKEALAKVQKYRDEDPTTSRRNFARQQEMDRQLEEELQQEELLKIQRDEEFQRRHAEEMEQIGKIRKFQESVALGEAKLVLGNTKGPQANVAQEQGWNQIAFLNQRPDPQPVPSSAGAADQQQLSAGERKRKILAAGGYDFGSREKRGWKEIERGILRSGAK